MISSLADASIVVTVANQAMIKIIPVLGISVTIAAGQPIVAVYDLDRQLTESGQAEESLLGVSMNSDRPLTFFDVTTSLKQASLDEDVQALVLDVDGSSLGLAQLQELRGHLITAREAGKDVWLYSDGYQMKTALLGSAANHFVLMPEADVSFSGISSESMYFKGLLDKAGVQADVIHIGDFKSFGEQFYRTGPSDFAQEQQEELIGGIFDQLIHDVSEGRSVESSQLMAMVDAGHFTAEDAKEAGLVDDLKYRTDLNAMLRSEYPEAKFEQEYAMPDLDGPDMDSIFDMFKLMMSSGDDKKAKGDYIGVVVLEGGISDESIAPVRSEILKLLKDEQAKALVLRVDSPGGSALSSEVLWEVTDEWKASGRPFAVSMGGVAASGGYYVSAGADRIFAESGTITGSIGVVGMKLVMGGAMDKLGITTHTTQRGRHAGAMSVTKPFTEEERKLVRDSMIDVYGTFKKRITDGRGDRLKGELEGMAGGRVYTGKRALELGLVDELGGLTDAIAWVAEKADMDESTARLRPEPKSMLEGMFAGPDKKKDDGEILRMTGNASPTSVALRAAVREAGVSQLPNAVRSQVIHALQQIDAISESHIQLIGPDIRISW